MIQSRQTLGCLMTQIPYLPTASRVEHLQTAAVGLGGCIAGIGLFESLQRLMRGLVRGMAVMREHLKVGCARGCQFLRVVVGILSAIHRVRRRQSSRSSAKLSDQGIQADHDDEPQAKPKLELGRYAMGAGVSPKPHAFIVFIIEFSV